MQSRTKESSVQRSVTPPICRQVIMRATPTLYARPKASPGSIHLLSMLLIAFAGSAIAADASPFTCKPDGNQQEMDDCAQRDYRVADAALNIMYTRVMARLPVAAQVPLRKEQRAWLRQRDMQCKAQTRSSEGGPIWTLEYFSCLQASTEKRTKELTHP